MKTLLAVSSTITIAGVVAAVLGAITSGPHGNLANYGGMLFLLGGCGVGYSVLTLDQRKRRIRDVPPR